MVEVMLGHQAQASLYIYISVIYITMYIVIYCVCIHNKSSEEVVGGKKGAKGEREDAAEEGGR